VEAEPDDLTPAERGAHEEGAAPTAGAIVTGGAADWRQALLVPALAFVAALAVGAIVIAFTNTEVLREWASFFRDPVGALRASWQIVRDAYVALFQGSFGNVTAISETLVATTPLIFAGLAVALGFRAGLFNIGAEGQITMGALLGSLVGFSYPGLPDPLHVVLIMAGAFIGGAAWGFIPGILKARTGAHEVITTIMLNFVASSFALWALTTELYRRPGREDPISVPVSAAFPHLFGSGQRVTIGLLVALGAAAAVAWLVNRTTVGFEFKAVGANPFAARAAGMSPARTIVFVMSLAGGLAGLAGADLLLGIQPSMTPGFSSGLGFDAIALALLGRARPAGVVLAALLFGALRSGARAMQAAAGTPVDIVVVIQALVIAFVAAPALVRAIFRIRARRVAGPEAFTKGWGG